MSMSIRLVGFQPADEQWQKMKAAWDACIAADIDPPDAVSEFFDGEDPTDAPGREIEIEGHGATAWEDEFSSGYEVDIQALPKGVRFVRFYCSW